MLKKIYYTVLLSCAIICAASTSFIAYSHYTTSIEKTVNKNDLKDINTKINPLEDIKNKY